MRTTGFYKIEGLDELRAALKELPEKYKNPIMRDAHKEILKGVKNVVRKKAPIKRLRKAGAWVVANDKLRKNRNPTAAIMGPAIEAYKLRWIERGTENRRIIRGVKKGKRFKKGSLKGAFRGRMTARPFIQQTHLTEANNIIQQAGDFYHGVLVKVLQRNSVRIRRKKGKETVR